MPQRKSGWGRGDVPRPDLPQVIRNLRLAAQLSQGEFAAAAGLRSKFADQNVSRWEHGHTTPEPNTLRMLGLALRIDPESFFEGWAGKPPAELLMEQQDRQRLQERARALQSGPSPMGSRVTTALREQTTEYMAELAQAPLPSGDALTGELGELYRDLCAEVVKRKRPITKRWVLSLLEELHHAHLGLPKPSERAED